MDDFDKQFAELSAASKTFAEKYEKFTKADMCGEGCTPQLVVFVEDLHCCVRSLNYQLEYLAQAFSSHMKGHLPSVKSTEQLKRAVKALGLDDEYDVRKPEITANRHGTFYVG